VQAPPLRPMLHVLRHYLPLRKALLILSETVLITIIVAIGMSAHLWKVSDGMWRTLAESEGLGPEQARSICFVSSIYVALLSQLSIAFNELYDFRFSASRFDRMARFTTSAGSAMLLVIVAAGVSEAAGLKNFLFFPGLPFSQRIVLLTTVLGLSFCVLYVWRNLFHATLQRLGYDERLLVLGSGRMADRLLDELNSRQDSGFRIVALLETKSTEHDRRRTDRRESATPSTGNPWFEAGADDPPSAGLGLVEGMLAAPLLGHDQQREPARPRSGIVIGAAQDREHVGAARERAPGLGAGDEPTAVGGRRGRAPNRGDVTAEIRFGHRYRHHDFS